MATTAKVKVIRIPRTDGPEDEPAFVLVHVSPRRSNPLDCKLIGTENTQVYLVSLKHTKTAELLQSKKLYTPEQWNQLLCFVLYGTPADDTTLVEDLEVSATADESTLKITIRKNVAGFKQKVGVIKLVQSDEGAANYDGFEWCGIALEETSHSTHELETLKSKVKEQEEAIEKLDASFKELIKAKADHEDELLQKFAALLNEKKLKIRDQQRLLASANVDPRKLAAVEATRQARSSDAGKSRAGKRKAAQRVEEAEEDSDDGFEKMDMDQDEVHNDSDADRGATPERDDDTTADEAEDTEDEEPILVAKPPKRAGEASGRDASPSKATANDELPPPRSLPFGKKAPTPKPPVVEGSDTESEGDDEL